MSHEVVVRFRRNDGADSSGNSADYAPSKVAVVIAYAIAFSIGVGAWAFLWWLWR